MSTPKLYLILINNNIVEDITTYRELDTILQAWNTLEISNYAGLIHCGFVRPKLSKSINLPKLTNGKVIYSSSLKWALPDFFKSSTNPVVCIEIDDQLTPCYLAFNQWDYEVSDEDKSEIEIKPPPLTENNNVNHKDTISLAAQQVLNDANKQPLNKEEIYARIIESNYYQFNTPTPVHVLDVTLNRETIDTEYSKAAKKPVFGKTFGGRYYLLKDKVVEPKGWVYTLSCEKPELYEQLHEFNISDDESYLTARKLLPNDLIITLDNIRFDLLKTDIIKSDPYKLLNIAPQWILERDIQDFGFTVRVSNALLQNDINNINALAKLTIQDLKQFPNMGVGSINDMCDAIYAKIINTTSESSKAPIFFKPTNNIDRQLSEETDLISLTNQIKQLPLRQHLERTLDELSEVDRLVLHGRLGYKGKVLTLEEIAGTLDVTRERVRQRQNKYIEKIISKEYWDDVIGISIGQLLLNREQPLILETLEIEDSWFDGFMGKYVYLSNVIQMFLENAIQVIEAQGRHVITRIKQKDWHELIKEVNNSLKVNAEQGKWTRADTKIYLESSLAQYSSKELLPLLSEMLVDYLQYDGEGENAILVTYGKTADSAVRAVLAQAEGPLHFTEIAKRATALFGRQVEERRAHGVLKAQDIWPFDRGTYGLINHCPLSEPTRKSIRLVVEELLYQGEINKQWHSKEIIQHLKEYFPNIPDELDPYILRMCIEKSEKIIFLKRMVWARTDSGMSLDDRVDLAEAFIEILEEAGEPLSGKELKSRLSDIRGVAENMQIHSNDRLVAVAPNVWGLSEWN